jgi:hypothetical protein
MIQQCSAVLECIDRGAPALSVFEAWAFDVMMAADGL